MQGFPITPWQLLRKLLCDNETDVHQSIIKVRAITLSLMKILLLDTTFLLDKIFLPLDTISLLPLY